MINYALIFAGGLGTRLRNAVPDLPKPMAPINGVPFLKYQMEYWERQGIKNFVLSVGYQREKIKAYFGTKFNSAEIVYSEEEVLVGTGGALILALKYLPVDSPFLVMNGDTWATIDFQDLTNFHQSKGSDCTIALFKMSVNQRYLGVEIKDNRVLSLKPNRNNTLDASCWINAGVYIINPQIIINNFDNKVIEPISLESDIFPILLNNKNLNIFGYKYEGRFIDIGIPEDYYIAPEIIQ